MVEVLFLMLYAGTLSYAVGVTTVLYIMKLTGEHEPWHLRSPLVLVVGLAVISLFVSVLHFFIPIDWRCHTFVWLALGAGFFFNRKQLISIFPDLIYRIRKSLWFNLLLLAVAVVSVCIKPGNGDIADYHLQAIKWAEHYKNLLGIGNFNRPLVNNNWWFNLQAFFGWHSAGVNSVYVLNGIWFIVLMIYFTRNVSEIKQRLFRVPVILFLLLTVKTAFIGSVTPDIVITGIIFLCFDLYLESTQSASKSFYSILISLLIFWAITIKATALLLLCLTALLLWELRSNKQFFKSIFLIAVFGIIWLAPWFAGNVVRGGWLLYPFNQIDLFNVDWKVPESYFEYDKIVLKGWGRIPFSDIYETAKMPYSAWVSVWFNNLDIFNKALIIAFIFSLISIAVNALRKKIFPVQIVAALIGVFMLFNSGPHMRFMYGYMIVIMGCALMQYAIPALKYARKAYMAALAVLLVFVVIKEHEKITLIEPLPYPSYQLQETSINGFTVYLPNSNTPCWVQFPCSPYIAEGTVLRTENIEDGFKVAK